MTKFIGFDTYNILNGQPEGKRVVNVDTIKELNSHRVGDTEITRYI